MVFKVDRTFYLNKGQGKPYKCHIVAIVDEEYIVYKWYGRRKQWWHYEVEHEWLLNRIIKEP